jgi:alpha-tubulin suppressor-like RCC1 family protein
VKNYYAFAALVAAAAGFAPDAGAALKVRQIAAGGEFVCALTLAREIKCWGNNTVGQLGLGDTVKRGDDANEMGDSLPFVDIDSANTTTAIEAGSTHACAIFGEGELKCWGGNSRGQLGLGDMANRGNNSGEMGVDLPVVDVAPGLLVRQVALGGEHTCARLDDGSVKCWGHNDQGQLGLGDEVDRGSGPGQMGTALPFVDLGPGRTARKITAGLNHTCAILDDGSVKCWGDNFAGQLGQGYTFDRGNSQYEMGNWLSAINLGTGRTAVKIDAGNDHTCALLDDDSVKCWGANGDGELGLGDQNARGDNSGEMGNQLPAVLVGVTFVPVSKLSAGGFHNCAIMGSVLRCWGSNPTGQLGLGDNDSRGDDPLEMGLSLPAVEIGTGRTPVQVEAGLEFTCLRYANERVKCWGANSSGQLGYGNRDIVGLDPADMGDALPFIDLGS